MWCFLKTGYTGTYSSTGGIRCCNCCVFLLGSGTFLIGVCSIFRLKVIKGDRTLLFVLDLVFFQYEEERLQNDFFCIEWDKTFIQYSVVCCFILHLWSESPYCLCIMLVPSFYSFYLVMSVCIEFCFVLICGHCCVVVLYIYIRLFNTRVDI